MSFLSRIPKLSVRPSALRVVASLFKRPLLFSRASRPLLGYSAIRDLATKALPKQAPVLKSSKPTNAITKPGYKGPTYVFPERFNAYHAGTGRTVFIGATKVSTFFLFVFFSTGIAPVFFNNPGTPVWMIPAIVVAGAFPLLIVRYATSPFVAYLHLKLPPAARQSRENLLHWAKNIPGETEITLTTLRMFGQARQTRTKLSELRQKSSGNAADVTNLIMTRKLSPLAETRPWYKGTEQTRFYIGTGKNHSKDPAIWKTVSLNLNKI